MALALPGNYDTVHPSTTERNMQTISRNTKAFKAAIANAQAVTCYDLASYFNGYATTAERLQAAAENGKMVKADNGTHSLRVHSNLWFEFKVMQ
jgi:hypothetical protein